ncbi:MAG: stage II sporulation protein M [Myxococcaceae bacterium]
MSEPLTAFVQRRKPDWDALETLLKARANGQLTLADVEKLDRLYRRATADLARAQSFYAGTDAERFLNQLVASGYASIYRPRPDRWAQLRKFYRYELPRTFRRERRYVAFSVSVFLLGILLGALVVAVEPRGAELLVPEHLRAKLHAHEIWTDDILQATPPGVVASQISTNNLTVLITTFVSGLALGLGPFLELAFNGVFLGATATVAAQNEMLGKLIDFIAAHGPVELSVIVLSGAGGFILGHALIEPGEHSRGRALQLRGREALKLVLGVSPALALIAFVEGYISPGDMFPTVVKAILGLALGAGLWTYLIASGRDADVEPAESASDLRRSR